MDLKAKRSSPSTYLWNLISELSTSTLHLHPPPCSPRVILFSFFFCLGVGFRADLPEPRPPPGRGPTSTFPPCLGDSLLQSFYLRHRSTFAPQTMPWLHRDGPDRLCDPSPPSASTISEGWKLGNRTATLVTPLPSAVSTLLCS